jgi:hypothetical protein
MEPAKMSYFDLIVAICLRYVHLSRGFTSNNTTYSFEIRTIRAELLDLDQCKNIFNGRNLSIQIAACSLLSRLLFIVDSITSSLIVLIHNTVIDKLVVAVSLEQLDIQPSLLSILKAIAEVMSSKKVLLVAPRTIHRRESITVSAVLDSLLHPGSLMGLSSDSKNVSADIMQIGEFH